MISITASTDQATLISKCRLTQTGRQQVCLDKSRFKKVYHMNQSCTTSKDDSLKKTLNMTFLYALQLEVKWKT